MEFVPEAAVDLIHVEKNFYIGPDKGGDKAFQLLAHAMKRMNKLAVGRYWTRGRQQVVLIRPHKNGLVMQYIYYANEVRNYDDVGVSTAPPAFKDIELDMADKLIAQLSSPDLQGREVQGRVSRSRTRRRRPENRRARGVLRRGAAEAHHLGPLRSAQAQPHGLNMCDVNPSTYRTNAVEKSATRESPRTTFYGLVALAFIGGMTAGAFAVLTPTKAAVMPPPAAKPAPTCRDSFEWITDRCEDPQKHTCEPGQKLEVKDDPGIHYMVCRCR